MKKELKRGIGRKTSKLVATRRTTPTRAIPIPKLKKKLWELIKKYIRARDKGICQACGTIGLTGANAQTSHLIASSICGGFLRYDQRNLYLCCFRCNISLSGNIAMLYRNVERQKGKVFMERLFQDKNKTIQLDRLFLENKIAEYENLQNKEIGVV